MAETIGRLYGQNSRQFLHMWSVDVAPGKRPFVPHSHTQFEITAVESGSGMYTTERREYPMEKGDMFVFSSNEVHSITDVGPRGLRIVNLHFEPRFLLGVDGLSREGGLAFCFFHSPDFENRIPAPAAACVREKHNAMRQEFERGETEYPAAVRAYLRLMLVELLRRHGYASADPLRGKDAWAGMIAAYDYIERHVCDPLRLDRIAQAANLSPSYFSALFKRLNGVSLWEYVTAKRIERAMHLIDTTDQTMLETALQCGFNNTANFNKAFRKQTGVTPTAYKKCKDAVLH